MWALARRVLSGVLVVRAREVAAAVLLLLGRNALLAEGAGAASVAAALNLHSLLPRSQLARCRKVVCLVSGGGISLSLIHI